MLEYNLSKIGENIRKIRKTKKFSQDALIDGIKETTGESFSRNTLSNLENGKISEIPFSNIVKIADFLGVSVGSLIGETDFIGTLEENFISEYLNLSVDTIRKIKNRYTPSLLEPGKDIFNIVLESNNGFIEVANSISLAESDYKLLKAINPSDVNEADYQRVKADYRLSLIDIFERCSDINRIFSPRDLLEKS